MASTFVVPKFGSAFSAVDSLFTKDFPHDDVSIQLDSLTSNGLKLSAYGVKNNQTGNIKSNLGLSFDSKENGVTLKSVWTQANAADFSLLIKNALFSDGNVEISGTLANTKSKAGIGFACAGNAYTLNANCSFSQQFSFAKVETVTGKNGFVGGLSIMYDMTGARRGPLLSMGGYISPEFSFLLKYAHNSDQLSLMGLHRVNRRVEVAWKGSGSIFKSVDNLFEVGAKYIVDSNTTVKSKVDNDGNLYLGLMLKINQNLNTTLGAKIDTKFLGNNTHKLGASFTLNL